MEEADPENVYSSIALQIKLLATGVQACHNQYRLMYLSRKARLQDFPMSAPIAPSRRFGLTPRKYCWSSPRRAKVLVAYWTGLCWPCLSGALQVLQEAQPRDCELLRALGFLSKRQRPGESTGIAIVTVALYPCGVSRAVGFLEKEARNRQKFDDGIATTLPNNGPLARAALGCRPTSKKRKKDSRGLPYFRGSLFNIIFSTRSLILVPSPDSSKNGTSASNAFMHQFLSSAATILSTP